MLAEIELKIESEFLYSWILILSRWSTQVHFDLEILFASASWFLITTQQNAASSIILYSKIIFIKVLIFFYQTFRLLFLLIRCGQLVAYVYV